MSDRFLIDPKLAKPASVKGTPDMEEALRYIYEEERGKHVVQKSIPPTKLDLKSAMTMTLRCLA